MVVEKTSELSASVHKAARNVEPGPMEPKAKNHLTVDDVESPQRHPTVGANPHMVNSQLSTSNSASQSPRRSPRRKRAPSIICIDDDSPLTESSSEVEITSPKHPPAKNNARSSQRSQKLSKHIFTSISSSSSPPTSTSGARAGVHLLPNATNNTVSKTLPTVPPKPHSNQPVSTSVNGKPSVSRKREIRQHAPPDARNALNPKLHSQPSASPATFGASTSKADANDLPVLEYDLDKDPTQETYEFHDQFHERSTFSAFLSARFIHPHLFERLSGSATFNEEPTNGGGDLVAEFIEPAAIACVGPHDEVTSSFPLDSTEVLGNSQQPPGFGDLGLEGTVPAPDPFAVMTMDDIINQQPWGPNTETVIDPALLGGTPAFSEPHSPTPAPATFRDFHSRKRPRASSPPPLRVRIPSHASTSQSNSARAVRDLEGNQGGGKAKFYKKGTLQTPPHLSNSQSRRSASAKTTPSNHASGHLSLDQVPDSPLTELSAWAPLAGGNASTSSIASSSEVANMVDDTGSDSDNPPRVTSAKTATSQKQKSSTNTKGPYRIVAVNKSSYCHQCRRATPHPKMTCRTCAKLYCISCIVKRYHDIEFHQFKKDFDCPFCLDKCNCTSCCDKRKEAYITSRHVKFDKETMTKLLSGEIRSLPHISISCASKGPKRGDDPTSSGRREVLSTTREARITTGRKRVATRRYVSDDDYDDDDDDYVPNAHSSGVRVKPVEAALQTRRMLEESGSGRYWGTVYSLSGERIGTSYVGNNLQNVTVQTAGFSSASATEYPPFRRKRVYVGKWQDAWGSRLESSDDSHSEDETPANKRARNKKDLGRAQTYYVGNQSIIKAWRKAQSKTVQSPPLLHIPSSDDVDIYVPSSDPPSLGKAYDSHEAAGILSNAYLPIGEEDDDGGRSYWTMEDRSPPKERNLPFLTATSTPGSGIDNVYDIRSTPTLGYREQLVSQEALAEVVASSLEAAGTTILLSQPLSTLSC